MGSDMFWYSRDVAINSHGGLMQACIKAEKKLLELGMSENDPLIKEIRKAIDNGTIR